MLWRTTCLGLMIVVAVVAQAEPGKARASTAPMPRLSDVLITVAEAEADATTDIAIASDLNPFLGRVQHLTVSDVTPELAGTCALDCVKVVWHVPVPEYWPDGYRRLTIVMIRMSSSEQAAVAVTSLHRQLNRPMTWTRELWDTDPFYLRNLPEQTWMLYNSNYTLATSSGPVVLLLTQRMRGFFDVDDLAEFSLVAKFAEMQLRKLEQAGFAN